MNTSQDKALIIQSDRTLLLDVHANDAEEARRAIGPFTELEKSPEHLHTYRISPLSLWNAAAAGLKPEAVCVALRAHSRYEVPSHLEHGIADTMGRFGLLALKASPIEGILLLVVYKLAIYAQLKAQKKLANWLDVSLEDDLRFLAQQEPNDKLKPEGVFRVKMLDRGTLKQELIKLGWPVKDDVPLIDGDPYEFTLNDNTVLRPYQNESIECFLGDGRPGLGYGAIVLPCGSGKTIVGLGLMAKLQTNTLILTVNIAAVHQWIREIRSRTDINPDDVGEYSGGNKQIRPITVATYQILTWRADKVSDFPHFALLRSRKWGLLIYDEVHLLPAPVFRITAELQALRRLGLTATLVREDGLESDVFSLVGPKRYDTPWKDMEAAGWIASVLCKEIRCDLPDHLAVPYAVAGKREKFRIASENPVKYEVVSFLVHKHAPEPTLVIGQYLDQLDELAETLNAPLITGRTPNLERDRLYEAFRNGEIHLLIVSKVANFAIDLPDASIAIQVSGSFGSRQEEAQRLGRILRPKARQSHFYTVVSRYTVEEEFSANRQQFLTEQGYRYEMELWEGKQ